MEVEIRKIVGVKEEVLTEGGRPVTPPVAMAAVGAVVKNLLAGGYTADLEPLIEAYCEPLGQLLARRALDLLGTPAEGMGKGALVGLAGEIEHGSAILHNNLRFGNFIRNAVNGNAAIPSAEKRAGAGATLDIAVKHKDDHKVRSHHQTFEVRIPDAPRDDELVIWVAFASGGRPQARLADSGSEVAASTS